MNIILFTSQFKRKFYPDTYKFHRVRTPSRRLPPANMVRKIPSALAIGHFAVYIVYQLGFLQETQVDVTR